MAGNTSSDHVDADRNFLASLHGHVLYFAAFENVVSAFVESITSSNLVPVFFDRHFHPVRAAGFLVAFRKVDHVAIETSVGAFQRDEYREVRDRHPLVVNGASAIKIAILYDGAEGIDAPFGFVDADDIEMAHQQESARWIGHGARGKPRDEESAAGRGLDNLSVDAFALENICDVFCGYEFVTRRIGAVNADQTLKPAERVTFELGEIG